MFDESSDDAILNMPTITITHTTAFASLLHECVNLLAINGAAVRLVAHGHNVPRCIALVEGINSIYDDSLAVNIITYSNIGMENFSASTGISSTTGGIAMRLQRIIPN